jgi:hypothetical protein
VVFAPEGRDDAPLEVPEVGSETDLRSMVELESVHVHQVVAGGLPYLGFALRCDWDEEHGAGVLLHGTRVVETGDQDTAFLLWIAERDAESRFRRPG